MKYGLTRIKPCFLLDIPKQRVAAETRITETMMTRKAKAHSTSHKPNTIPAAAKKLKDLMSEGMLRRAVQKEQVNTIDFAGLRRITDAEIERIRGLFETRPNQAAE
jgi:predicted RNA-binding protein